MREPETPTPAPVTVTATVAATVTVTVNGDRRTHPATTLDRIAAAEGVPATGSAIALNGAVVPRSAWRDQQIADGDRIEIVTAVQGG